MSHPIRKSDAQMRLECIHAATRILGKVSGTSELLALADVLWDWVIQENKTHSARDLPWAGPQWDPQ